MTLCRRDFCSAPHRSSCRFAYQGRRDPFHLTEIIHLSSLEVGGESSLVVRNQLAACEPGVSEDQ